PVHRALPAGIQAFAKESTQVPAGFDGARAPGARLVRQSVLDAGNPSNDMRGVRDPVQLRVLGACRRFTPISVSPGRPDRTDQGPLEGSVSSRPGPHR